MEKKLIHVWNMCIKYGSTYHTQFMPMFEDVKVLKGFSMKNSTLPSPQTVKKNGRMTL